MLNLLKHKYAPYVAFVIGLLIVFILHFLNPELLSFGIAEQFVDDEMSETTSTPAKLNSSSGFNSKKSASKAFIPIEKPRAKTENTQSPAEKADTAGAPADKTETPPQNK